MDVFRQESGKIYHKIKGRNEKSIVEALVNKSIWFTRKIEEIQQRGEGKKWNICKEKHKAGPSICPGKPC